MNVDDVDELFAELGPGSRLDQELDRISEKLGMPISSHQGQVTMRSRGAGAEIDSQIRELQIAVKELQRKQEESSKVRLHRVLDSETKEDYKMFEQREDLLDKPQAQPPCQPIQDDREKIHQAVERAIEETHQALKEAITLGEKSFEEALREGKLGLMDGINTVVDHFAIASKGEDVPQARKWI